jgi:hypothetical protein
MVTPCCIECGATLMTGAPFCENCGLKTGDHFQPIEKPSTLVVKIAVCPQCGQADKVAKVSGIVSAGFRQEERQWRDRDFNNRFEEIVTSTKLASQLRLAEPYKYRPFHPGCLALVLIPLTFAILALVVSVVISVETRDWEPFHAVVLAIGVIATLIVPIVAIIVIIVIIRGPGLRRKAATEARLWRQRKQVGISCSTAPVTTSYSLTDALHLPRECLNFLGISGDL